MSRLFYFAGVLCLKSVLIFYGGAIIVLAALSLLANHFNWNGVGVVLSFFFCLLTFWAWYITYSVVAEQQHTNLEGLRQRGLYPITMKITDKEVARLKGKKEMLLAIYLWREIHGGSLREATRVVRSI